MIKKYNVEKDEQGNEIVWYEDNGVRVSFTANPANADYQEYLNPSAQSKEITTPQGGNE